MKLDKKNIIRFTIGLFLIIMVGLFVQGKAFKDASADEVVLDKHWDIVLRGERYDDQSLSEFSVKGLKKGEVISISRKVKTNPRWNQSIRFLARYSRVAVFMNGLDIYDHGYEEYSEGKSIGSGYCWAPVPYFLGEGDLRIEYIVGEDNAFVDFGDVKLVKTSQMYSSLLAENLITSILVCFLILGGCFLLLSGLVVDNINSLGRRMIWLGLFSLESAVWISCNSKIIEIFFQTISKIYQIEYISMYLTVITVLFGIEDVMSVEAGKCKLSILGLFAFFIEGILVLLHYGSSVSFHQSVYFFQSVIVICFLITAYYIVHYAKGIKKNSERVFLAGIGASGMCIVLEVLRYQYNQYISAGYEFQKSLIPIGLFIFIAFVIGSIACSMMEIVTERIEKEQLYDMAYTDKLTGLKNRAWCEKIMMEYDEQNKQVVIINLDLNKFKSVNDTLGHAMGDKLLQVFSAILEKTFSGHYCVGRMGGDEFIVIMDYCSNEEVNHKIKQLARHIQQENETGNHDFQLSTSYGYASSCEVGGEQVDVWKVYRLADKRMYKYKRSVKK